MTKWLADLLAKVPADFRINRTHGKSVPENATVLGPLPEDIKPLLAALGWLRASRAKHQGKLDRRTFWEFVWQDQQEKVLSHLITVSIHHHFGVFGRPVGAGLDKDETLIAFSFPTPDPTSGLLVAVISVL